MYFSFFLNFYFTTEHAVFFNSRRTMSNLSIVLTPREEKCPPPALYEYHGNLKFPKIPFLDELALRSISWVYSVMQLIIGPSPYHLMTSFRKIILINQHNNSGRKFYYMNHTFLFQHNYWHTVIASMSIIHTIYKEKIVFKKREQTDTRNYTIKKIVFQIKFYKNLREKIN